MLAQKAEKWIELGDQAFEENDYYGAYAYYGKAMQIDSTKAEWQYKFAESARGINNYSVAARFYEKVYKKERGRFYPDGVFHLANMLKYLGDYKESSKYWRRARSKRKRDSFIYRKSIQEIKATQWANLEKENIDENFLVNPLTGQVNSSNSEFNPVITKDSILLFSSLPQKSGPTGKLIENNDAINIYFSKYKGEWQKPQSTTSEIAALGYHFANGTYDHENNIYFFTICGREGECSIYESSIENGQLINPQRLNDFINLKGSTNTQPHFSSHAGTDYLYFVSNRKGGLGGLDIYVSQRKQGDWSDPENVGENINSPEDDVTPFFDPVNQKLYFSSSWHFGFGGQDIFVAEKRRSNDFEIPSNMGIPINSSANDLYFSIFDGKNGFITSNRDGSSPWSKGTCCNDMYEFRLKENLESEQDTLPEIEGIDDLAAYLPVTLYFHNDEPNPKTTDTTTTINYLKSYQDYLAIQPTYRVKYALGLNLEEQLEADSLIDNFFSQEVTGGVKDLELVTQLILRELENGKRIDLGIKGYASPLAKGDYNKNLTLRRIQSLINYFESYDKGVFKKFMYDVAPGNGYLGFKKIPYGETKADTLVSDNVNDQRNSVYSRAAARERKIEILFIQESSDSLKIEESKTNKELSLDFNVEKKNLGTVRKGKTILYSFEFKNSETSDLKIDHVQPECGCTLVTFPTQLLRPGDEGEIVMEIDTSQLKRGPNQKSLVVIANDGEIIQELTVQFEVK